MIFKMHFFFLTEEARHRVYEDDEGDMHVSCVCVCMLQTVISLPMARINNDEVL